MEIALKHGWALWGALVLAALALLIPYWPLALLAILLAALAGIWPLALVLGILFDILYGRPPGGFLHALSFPITALALAAVILRRFAARYLRRERQEFL